MPKIYRRRYIPNETIHLADDEIITHEPNFLITRWKCLKPRDDFASGLSAYYINRNFKISKFFKEDGSFRFYYCDIIKTIADDSDGSLIFCDLLIDLVVFPDYTTKVLDLHELRPVYDDGLIDINDVFMAIDALDDLLQTVHTGEFSELIRCLEKIDKAEENGKEK